MRYVYGLSVLLVGIFVLLLAYDTGSRHASSFIEPRDAAAAAARQAQQPSGNPKLPETGPMDAVGVAVPGSVDVAEDRSDATHVERSTSPKTGMDEHAARERTRKRVTRDVRDSYSLLFADLRLTSQEKEALFSFLIETRMARTWIGLRGRTIQTGKPMEKGERAKRIAAIIGDRNLQQFLALERNLASYRDVRRIGYMFERQGVPLTEAQRDELFKILAASRNWDYAPVPSGESEPYSLEQLEDTLTRINERERHVIQLAPAVLSPQQTVHLHGLYQHCSDERANALERQRDRRAANPDEPRPVSYPVCGP